jgi:hypothetical protein
MTNIERDMQLKNGVYWAWGGVSNRVDWGFDFKRVHRSGRATARLRSV